MKTAHVIINKNGAHFLNRWIGWDERFTLSSLLVPCADITIAWAIDNEADALMRALGKVNRDDARARHEFKAGVLQINLLPASEDWRIGAEDAPGEILLALQQYESAFGRAPRYNASGTGLRLIRDSFLQLNRADELEPIRAEWFEALNERIAQAIIWNRAIDPSESDSAPYIIAFDKKASYLNAADCECGIGQPEYAPAASARALITANTPGIFYLETKRPIDIAGIPFKSGCYYTPMAKALMQLAGESNFDITEALVFRRHKRALVRWREKLTTQLDHAAGVYRGMVKATYTRAIGLLGSSLFGASDLYRPDWRAQVVSTAAARMLFNIVKVEREAHLLPVAVYDDALYYQVDAETAQCLDAFFKTAMGRFERKGVYRIAGREYISQKTPAVFARLIKEAEVSYESIR